MKKFGLNCTLTIIGLIATIALWLAAQVSAAVDFRANPYRWYKVIQISAKDVTIHSWAILAVVTLVFAWRSFKVRSTVTNGGSIKQFNQLLLWFGCLMPYILVIASETLFYVAAHTWLNSGTDNSDNGMWFYALAAPILIGVFSLIVQAITFILLYSGFRNVKIRKIILITLIVTYGLFVAERIGWIVLMGMGVGVGVLSASASIFVFLLVPFIIMPILSVITIIQNKRVQMDKSQTFEG